MFFSFSQKLYWDSENIVGLKSGNLMPRNLLLLLLFNYSWHASHEIFIAAVVSLSTVGTYSMNPCRVSHQMRHLPFSHLAAWEESQCMKSKTEERGHHFFCMDSLQKVISVQQYFGKNFVVCFLFTIIWKDNKVAFDIYSYLGRYLEYIVIKKKTPKLCYYL